VCVEVSDLRKRFERMTARGEARDPRSFEQFMDQEKKEEEIFHIEEASRRADVIINNDETLADLHAAIKESVERGEIPVLSN
ncbi:MAG: hypothetical protein PHU03_06695, partial [Syntrophales bacterium]|nr:hypothetical protein [Syntrophales bacterium]